MMTGLAAALAAALLWTVATRLFQQAGRHVAALELNAAKGAVALLLFSLWIATSQTLSLHLPARTVGLLLLSGLIGIGLGDTAYFRALNALGTRRVLLLELLAAPSAALLALVFLGEEMAAQAVLGLLITLGGVALAVSGLDARPTATGSTAAMGWGLFSAACQGLGVVLARAAFEHSALAAAPAAWWRLLGGELVLLAGLSWRWKRPGLLQIDDRVFWLKLLSAAALGTWLGIWLQQAALARLGAGYTQTLLATAPLFAMGLAALAGRRILGRAVLGALGALLGVALLALSA